MYKIYFLTADTHTDSNGVEDTYTQKDLEYIRDSYNIDRFEAPVVIGHEDDLESLYTAKDSIPSYGWVKKVGLDEGGLYAEAELAEELETLVDRKVPVYKHISAAIYEKDNAANPLRGESPYLRHIAFLGGTPPAIKGLQDPLKMYAEDADVKHSLIEYEGNLSRLNNSNMKKKKFYKEEVVKQYDEEIVLPNDEASDEEVASFLENNAADFLSFILQDGEFGYPGEISRYEPEPTLENKYLYDEQKGRFSGVFYDDTSTETEGFTFTIGKGRDGQWFSSYRPVNQEEEESQEELDIPAMTEETIEEDDEEKDIPTMAEKNIEEENQKQLDIPAMAEESIEEDDEEKDTPVMTEKSDENGDEEDMDVNGEGKKKYAEPQLNESEESKMASQEYMSNEEEDSMADGELPEIDLENEDRQSDLQSEIELMREEAKALRNEVLRLKTELNELQMNEFKNYTEAKKTLLETLEVSEKDMVKIVASLGAVSKTKAYSENKKVRNPLAVFKEFLDKVESKLSNSKNSVVSYGEFLPDGEDDLNIESYMEDEDPSLYDEDSLRLNREIIKYCVGNNLDPRDPKQYAEAYRKVKK